MHTTPNSQPLLTAVCKAAFPDYTGRKLQIRYQDTPINMASYWSGGSNRFYVVIKLSDMTVLEIPQQSMNDRNVPEVHAFQIPSGAVVVEHNIFCGKDLGLTIYCRSDGQKLLPASDTELTEHERLVLKSVRGLKSSYAGISDYRAHELKRKYNLTAAEIASAREELKAKKLLTAAGAITNSGKDVLENDPQGHMF